MTNHIVVPQFVYRMEDIMREIPEQQIAAMAPNANAVNNARKIVNGGSRLHF